MPNRRRDLLRRRRSTRSIGDFKYMIREFKGRANIVAEGDSWFDYPRKFVVAGKPANILDHIQKWAQSRANLLRLESNGDEATQMLSGDSRHKLTKLLYDCVNTSTLRPVDVVLFSAGGNDVVGAWDIPRFLKEFRTGFSAADCIQTGRLNNKVKQIELAYVELVEICREYSPTTVVVTHTYDRIFPSDQGVELLGIDLTNSWVKPYMDDRGIPANLHRPVADLLLGRLGDMLLALEQRPAMRGRLVVADTQGTLGSPGQWLNEIHPTSKGFEKIARKVYSKLRSQVSGLPAP